MKPAKQSFQIYPVVIEPDGDIQLVTFPDVPEAATFGSTEKEALHRAIDCLKTLLDYRITHDEDVPLPSRPRRGQKVILLPPLVAKKLVIYSEMRRQGITREVFAERLSIDAKAMVRLLNLYRESSFTLTDKALTALGKRVEITIRDAA